MLFGHDVELYGKHAGYLKFFVKNKNKNNNENNNETNAEFFERYIDVYMCAAVFGLLYGRKAKECTSSKSDDRARIYADAFVTEHDNCMFLYRLVMLLDETTDLTHEERLDRAFRDDTDDKKKDKCKKNMELFHEYVRGGIEVMYEKFIDGRHTKQELLDRSFELLREFAGDVDNKECKSEQILEDSMDGIID